MVGLALIGFDNKLVASGTARKAVKWAHEMFGYLISWVLLWLLKLRYSLLLRVVKMCFVGCRYSGRPWSFFDCFLIDGANC